MKKLISVLLAIALLFTTLSGFSVSAGISVTIEIGDVNASGTINNKDLGLLMQYLNDWEVDGFFVAVADTNADGKVNNKDYGYLMQYLNGWDVVLGKQPETVPDDSDNGNDDNNDNNGFNPGDSTIEKVNPEDYRGTEVVFATTILSESNEAGPVIDAFEKKYGITVKEILVGDNVNEIAGNIAAGFNVDVMRVNGDFPAAMAVLQPITAAKLDYTDPIWDQSVFKYTTFGGEPYLCNTISNIWSEQACVIYSKNLLARANCYTPKEYDAQGKWTWDAFATIAKQVDAIDGIGTGIRGCYDTNNFLLGSIGCALYKYEDGKFVNGLKDPLHREAMAKIASWNKEGFYSGWIPFTDGKVGITTGLVGWSLKKNGSNANYNWNDIGFYYMPAYKEGMQTGGTGPMKAWGICRGADNPVGAGIFLRYYLDTNNYDASDAFISEEAATFFFRMNDGFDMDYFTPVFTHSDSTEKLTGFSEWEWEVCAYGDPTQVDATFDKLSGAVDKACDIMNKFVAKNTGIRE